MKNIPKIDNYVDTGKYFKLIDKSTIKIFYNSETPEIEKKISTIDIKRTGFKNHLAGHLKYINYFLEYFDTKHDLLGLYYITMYQIISSKSILPLDHFISLIETHFTDKDFLNAIIECIEYNIDTSTIKTKNIGAGPDSLQITAEHVKCMLAVAFSYKLVIPIINHYLLEKASNIDLSERNFYFIIFAIFIPIFDNYYDVEIYNKFYLTATSRTSKIVKNKKVWGILSNVGMTPLTHTNKSFMDFFIDATHKINFNRSFISYIHKCLDRAGSYTMQIKTPENYIEYDLSVSDDDDQMSPLDTLIQNNSKIDLKNGTKFRAIITSFIKSEVKRLNIEDFNDRVKYYTKHYNPTEAQSALIYSFIIKKTRLGVEKFIVFKDLVSIMIILKKTLELEGYTFLQILISGNYSGTKPKRINSSTLDQMLEDYDIKEIFSHCGIMNVDRHNEYLKSLIAPAIVLDYDLWINDMITNNSVLSINAMDTNLMTDEIYRFIRGFE